MSNAVNTFERAQRPSGNQQDMTKSTRPIHPSLLKPGITGADFTLPLFDGLSSDPKDYLIDLDTDSMEKYPDVRVYFWMVGHETLMNAQVDQPRPEHDLPEQIIYDDRLVKMGRQHLKESQAKGQGYYISPHRYSQILANNVPGDDYYRLPTVTLAIKLRDEEIEPIEWEGTFFEYKDEEEWYIGNAFKTNIRVPIIWAEAFKDGIIPGMNGWDATIKTAYSVGRNPVYSMMTSRDRSGMIIDLMLSCAGNTPDCPCDPTVIYRIIDQVWPGAADVSDEEEEEHDRPSLFELQGITLDDFLGVKRK